MLFYLFVDTVNVYIHIFLKPVYPMQLLYKGLYSLPIPVFTSIP